MGEKIGELAIAEGWISPRERDIILAKQKDLRDKGDKVLFGELLVAEDLVEKSIVEDLLRKQQKIDKNFHLKPFVASDYEFFEEIGAGGMGNVYRVFQLSLQRDAAIKKVRGKKQPEQKQRFIAEALVTAYLDHPNIVSIYELGECENGELALVMKLVRGSGWRELLATKTLTLDDHLRNLLNVCNAVAFAHSKGIVHNDLKLDNIMIGEFGEILVMDWGLAVDIREQTANRAIPKSAINNPIGTPGYMPPELASGRGDLIGEWTDVYLLGTILYEILMKEPLHKGRTKKTADQSCDDFTRACMA